MPLNAKVEVSSKFSGDTTKGPPLKAYLADLQSAAARWRANGLSMRVFFQQLAPTLEGEAKLYYINEADDILAQPEKDAYGRAVCDMQGRLVPMQDPCRAWAERLAGRFRGITAEKQSEYQHFACKKNETAMSLYERLYGLAGDLDISSEKELIRKYLDAIPGKAGGLLRSQVIAQMGQRATLRGVSALHAEIEQGARLYQDYDPPARPKVGWQES